jgi:hypothetical protein
MRFRHLAVVAAITLTASAARASITLASAGLFTGRVSVTGKSPYTSYEVWQSTGPAGPAGNVYVDTGMSLLTDISGNGSVSIVNSAAGALHAGHNVKIGTTIAPDSQPAVVVSSNGPSLWPGNWFGALPSGTSGPHGLVFRQSVFDGTSTLLETWDANTVISIGLFPSDASWVDMGASIVPHGDLQATILSVTAQFITIQIVADPTHTTSDDLEVQGVGIDVSTLGSVAVEVNFNGSTSEYVDNVLVQSDSFPVTQTYQFARASIVGSTGSFCGTDDASVTHPCPGGLGTAGLGCGNSANPAGALLEAHGTPAMDNVVFTASGELPAALSIVLQGDAKVAAGAAFGDGVSCVGGTLLRLYVHNAVNGTVSAPQGGDPSVKTRSATLGDPILPGATRYYQCYYRDPHGVTGANFNVTNAMSITWP